MTHLILTLTTAFAAGVILGLLFLLALWRSLQTLASQPHPGLRMAAGMALRIVLTAMALFIILQLGDWRHLLASVAGFTLVRWLMPRRILQLSRLIPKEK